MAVGSILSLCESVTVAEPGSQVPAGASGSVERVGVTNGSSVGEIFLVSGLGDMTVLLETVGARQLAEVGGVSSAAVLMGSSGESDMKISAWLSI